MMHQWLNLRYGPINLCHLSSRTPAIYSSSLEIRINRR
ncbi:Protein of unknown function [Pyronema omphalodes CBS 100304]|uniref:Uncharacterized protein n=1 Tax=Pyronema omphalodes (strain CBS 100304) TaxID=1076935 RepID=U4LNM2_PYROM|nr:Protein of unknown function [Pyronema omphalodes CBS 100304]